MKKILIVARGYYPYDDSSGGNVLRKIVNSLVDDNEIDIFSLFNPAPDKKTETYSDGKTRVIYNNRQIKSRWEDKPGFFLGWLLRLEGYNLFHIIYANNELKRLCKVEKYDLVVSVSWPFEAHVCAMHLKRTIKLPWIAYCLDPYFSNKQLKDSSMRRRLVADKKVLSYADMLITLPQMGDEYSKCVRSDTKKIDLPLLTNFAKVEKKRPFAMDKGFINCLYAGNLYGNIRRPDYVLDLFKKMSCSNVRLYLVGIKDGFEEGYFENWEKELDGKLILVDRLNEVEINGLYEQADVLINIGNNIKNQLPGKVISLLSTGKPIINVCKMEDCPSIPYYSRCRNTISLIENETLIDSQVEKVRSFVENSKDMSALSYDEICSLYPELVVDNIMAEFQSCIDNATI